jgi:hypothetical protein
MRMTGRILALGAGFALLASPGAAGQLPSAPTPAAPSEALTQLLRQNLHPIRLEGGQLTGPGADLLFRELASAQFVGLGEVHNNRDIPAIATALFRHLHDRQGFNYFADEQDPVTMRAVSARGLRGDADAIGRAVRAEPYSVTFNTDQEIEMLAEIGRIASGRHRPIWGCEQAFGVSHILRRLEAVAPNAEARSFIQAFRQRAATAEAQRDRAISTHFLGRTELSADIERLRAFFPRPNLETAFQLRALTMSSEIYGYYRAGDRNELPGYWSNSAVREEYMKEVCRDEYRAALAADRTPPRVLFKFGHWHVYGASSPANIPTLGAFFSQAALMNEMGYRSIALTATQYDGAPVWEGTDGGMRPFAPVMAHDGWGLLDLRPFRQYPNFRMLAAALGTDNWRARAELTRFVYGFDFAFFVGAHRDGSYERAGVLPAPSGQ